MKEYFRNHWLSYSGLLLALILVLIEARSIGDFEIFVFASGDLLAGENIYDIRYHEWYHYYYDILFALVLTPFTNLPLYYTNLIWLTLNVYFIYRIWKILLNWLPIDALKRNYKIIFIILSFLFILRFIRDNFHLGQVTIFILWLALEGLYLIMNQKKISGSLLLAIGINIKLFPLVLIPYLIYRNEWKSALYTVGFILLLLFLPSIIIGYDYNNFLLVERWHLINPLNDEHILDTSERSFHSLTTLLATLLVKNCPDTHILPIKRNIADISINNLNIIINVVRGILILSTLYFLRSFPFKRSTFKIQKLYELSYIFLIIPLIFPHQQHYAFFFIFPASTYLLFYFIYFFKNEENFKSIKHFKAKKISIIIILGIIYFLTSSHFILGMFNNYYDHFKTLTYGVILLLILLVICKPFKLYPLEQEF